MKTPLLFILTAFALAQGCATTPGSVVYGIASDVKKSECRQFPEPRRSACLEELDREMKAQEELAEDIARGRDSRRTP